MMHSSPIELLQL